MPRHKAFLQAAKPPGHPGQLWHPSSLLFVFFEHNRSFAVRSCRLLAPQNYIAQQRDHVVSLCKHFAVRSCRLLVLQSHLSRRRRLSQRALVQWLQHQTWMCPTLR